jgi:hypothetical protein
MDKSAPSSSLRKWTPTPEERARLEQARHAFALFARAPSSTTATIDVPVDHSFPSMPLLNARGVEVSPGLDPVVWAEQFVRRLAEAHGLAILGMEHRLTLLCSYSLTFRFEGEKTLVICF